MKRFIFGVLAMLLLFGLNGCSDSKPTEEDVVKSANQAILAFKEMGYGIPDDLDSYIEIDSANITDSYQKGDFYIVKAIPHITIKEDLDKAIIKSKFHDAYTGQVIALMEGIKKYQDGIIKKGALALIMRVASPDGSLRDGDEFDGLESTYKFRKTDNGWREVEWILKKTQHLSKLNLN